MPKKNKIVSVIWRDARLYSYEKDTKESLTPTKCFGELIKKDKEFIILKNCSQFVYNKKNKNFPFKRKVNFFYIPKGMIKDIKIIKS